MVEKSGSWFSYNSQRLGQGRENSRQFLLENPEIADEIELGVRQSAGLIEGGDAKGDKGLVEIVTDKAEKADKAQKDE